MGLLDQGVDSEVTGSRRWRPHHEKRVLEIVKRVGEAEMGLNEEDGGSYLFLLFSLEKGRTTADGAPVVNSHSRFSFSQTRSRVLWP